MMFGPTIVFRSTRPMLKICWRSVASSSAEKRSAFGSTVSARIMRASSVGQDGELSVAIPRDRDSSSEPDLVKESQVGNATPQFCKLKADLVARHSFREAARILNLLTPCARQNHATTRNRLASVDDSLESLTFHTVWTVSTLTVSCALISCSVYFGMTAFQ